MSKERLDPATIETQGPEISISIEGISEEGEDCCWAGFDKTGEKPIFWGRRIKKEEEK